MISSNLRTDTFVTIISLNMTPQMSNSTPETPGLKTSFIRWMDHSSLSAHPDHRERPICNYPLGFNHCLWEWSKTPSNRTCFRARGFRVRAAHLWSHVKSDNRDESIRSEIRAYYDIIPYDSVVSHVNIHTDPSTGHMLQTLQIV